MKDEQDRDKNVSSSLWHKCTDFCFQMHFSLQLLGILAGLVTLIFSPFFVWTLSLNLRVMGFPEWNMWLLFVCYIISIPILIAVVYTFWLRKEKHEISTLILKVREEIKHPSEVI